MTLAMEWAVQGLVVPHVGRTIDSTVEAINAGLRSLKAGYRRAGQGGGDRRSRLGGGLAQWDIQRSGTLLQLILERHDILESNPTPIANSLHWNVLLL
jgi:hypothetical protein